MASKLPMFWRWSLIGPFLVAVGTTASAQFNSFAERFPLDEATNSLANGIPWVRVSGIGSLTQLSDSLQSGASLSVMAEFNFLDLKVRGNPWNKALRFCTNFNVNRTIRPSSSDSIQLADIFFPDQNRFGFGAGLSYDAMRLLTGLGAKAGSASSVHLLKGDNDKSYFDHFRLEPTLEYGYSRWDLRSKGLQYNADSTAVDTVDRSDRLQSSQWLFGIRFWYTVNLNKNVFGFMLYPHTRFQSISDGTYGLFNDLFRSRTTEDKAPQGLTFYCISVGLQLNKVQFTFTYSELAQQKWITDNDVAGGVFLVKVSVISDFLEF